MGDDDLLGGSTRVATQLLNILDDVLSLNNTTKDDMLAIQPRAGDGSDEELASVGVGSGVGHAQEEGLSVLELEVLVVEALSVDGLASSAVVSGEITTLAHELGDDAVEGAALVAKALLASAQGAEVLGSLGDSLVEEFKDNAAKGSTTGGNLKVDTGAAHFKEE